MTANICIELHLILSILLIIVSSYFLVKLSLLQIVITNSGIKTLFSCFLNETNARIESVVHVSLFFRSAVPFSAGPEAVSVSLGAFFASV